MAEVKLLPINESGTVQALSAGQELTLPEMTQQLNDQMADFYAAAGYQPPWIGYVSESEGQVVGGGAFKAVPVNGQVEIAYYTLPELENMGYATATAQALIDLTIQTDEELTIVAQTLPETNASNFLLQKLGFNYHDVVDHPEDGPVWEWHLF